MARSFWLFILPLLLLQEPLDSAAETICRPGAIDLMFVMDESDSVGLENYKIGLEAAAKLSDSLNIGTGEQQSRVGFVCFNDSAGTAFFLTTYSSNADVRNAITSLWYRGGLTNITAGMDAAIEVFLREGRTTVPRVMILITVGGDDSNVEAEQSLAAQSNIRVYAVGVGPGVDMEELERATGDASLVYKAEDYASLSNIMSQVCENIEASVAPPPTPTSFVHNPKDCGCNNEMDYMNIWLDIIFIFDTSSEVANEDINNYRALLSAMGMFYAIGESKSYISEKYARVAIVTNSDKAERFANFSTYKNGVELQNAVSRIGKTGNSFNPQLGLQAAQDMIDEEKKATRRLNVKKVVVLFSSIAIECVDSQKIKIAQNKDKADQNEICRFLAKMGSEGTVVMTVAVKLPTETDFPAITVGDECGRFDNDANMVENVMKGLCQANCYCLNPYIQFRDDSNCIRYGECLFVHNTALSYGSSQYSCQESKGNLSTIKSEKQDNFIKEMHLDAGFFPYWIGMQRIYGNFYYSTGEQVDAYNDYYGWCDGEPDFSKGDCVYYGQCGKGFLSGWRMDKCGMMLPTHYFSCAKDACSANNYCDYN